MIVPALIYFAHQPATTGGAARLGHPGGDRHRLRVGVLALLGIARPGALKMFLLALAIIDDLGAIVIIAFFYTARTVAARARAGRRRHRRSLALLNRAASRASRRTC